jgi:hypothetical protein
VRIHEAIATPFVETQSQPGRVLVEVISPGWGSSGYYSAKVLENAVSERVWPAGTHVYVDHPTDAEAYERPVRTVKDLVGRMAEDAYVDPEGRIVGAVDIFTPFRPLITDEGFIEAVGMSIRANAESTVGEAEGRKGRIITRLVPDPLNSVDIVTHAGRGGRILAVLESATAPATEATVSDQRAALQAALEAAYAGEKSYVGTRDFDPDATLVWFWYETPAWSATYQQGYEVAADGSVTLAGSPIEVHTKTIYVPKAGQSTESAPTHVLAPAGPVTTQPPESKEDTMQQIEESRLAQLEQDAGRVPALEAERDTARAERDEALAESRAIRAADAARVVINEAQAAHPGLTLTALEHRGLTAALPMREDGGLDVEAYRSSVEAALAEKAKAGGAGAVRGFGSTAEAQVVPSWDDIDTVLKGA